MRGSIEIRLGKNTENRLFSIPMSIESYDCIEQVRFRRRPNRTNRLPTSVESNQSASDRRLHRTNRLPYADSIERTGFRTAIESYRTIEPKDSAAIHSPISPSWGAVLPFPSALAALRPLALLLYLVCHKIPKKSLLRVKGEEDSKHHPAELPTKSSSSTEWYLQKKIAQEFHLKITAQRRKSTGRDRVGWDGTGLGGVRWDGIGLNGMGWEAQDHLPDSVQYTQHRHVEIPNLSSTITSRGHNRFEY